MDVDNLRKLYLSGLSMRQIGAKLGCSYGTVWFHLRKHPDHHSTVTNILVSRVLSSQSEFDVTRTHAHRRRLKHSLAMLRQKRPELYAAAVESGRPTVCAGCSRAIQATLKRGLWAWQCSYCGARDFEKAQSVAVLLRNNASK